MNHVRGDDRGGLSNACVLVVDPFLTPYIMTAKSAESLKLSGLHYSGDAQECQE